ncbi:MAG: winged helix-turn-helix transcriptional regulator [Burkholderiaceae bacterium]|nr:winged helix-turn-helix transcriptional regulator [Burkholderiaceae bacterium]
MSKPLSKKEQLFALVSVNPYVSQQELADALQLSRSAIAGHIAALIREGRILGRAYTFPGTRAILCIGGANIDRKLRTLAGLQMGTSNPASQTESYGGVARNIAENLARQGVPATLICAVGDDVSGNGLMAHADSAGIDTSGSLHVAGACSGTYTAILDNAGELVLALAHMELCELLDRDYLAGCRPQLNAAAMIVADMNLPSDSIQLLMNEAVLNNKPLVIVAVSQPKMARLPASLKGVRLLILNQAELEQRLATKLTDTRAIIEACAQLQAQGVTDVIVTLGADGIVFTDSKHNAPTQYLPAPKVEVVDVTGAGDAFSAAVCGSLHYAPEDMLLACQRGLQLAALTIQTDTSVLQTPHTTIFNEEPSCNPI